jgi:hypothetical protein
LSNAAHELGADLEPRRLAIMHGSSYAGDCPALLRAMADVYERQFGCGGGIPAQPLPGHHDPQRPNGAETGQPAPPP